MRRTFKYRLYPTPDQQVRLAEMLETHRILYNDCLAERKRVYEGEKRSVTKNDQSKAMSAGRSEHAYHANLNSHSLQMTVDRLDLAYQAFFRRVKTMKKGEAPGFPHFKRRDKWDSMIYRTNGYRVEDGHLIITKCGSAPEMRIPLLMHRAQLGTIKTMAIKREADGWHCVLSCDLGEIRIEQRVGGPEIGIDVGLKTFAVASDGQTVESPKYYAKVQKQLRRAQRSLSRKQKGSNRRKKAKEQVAKLHLHVKNQRRDFQFKAARTVIGENSMVAHEKLDIRQMVEHAQEETTEKEKARLRRAITDAGWGGFFEILKQKGEQTGTRIVPVPAAFTTRQCSKCGVIGRIRIKLSQRVFRCEHCGHVQDRDLNAAKNVLARAKAIG